MKHRLSLCVLTLVFCLGYPAPAQNPKNVILFIGDGMGFEHVKAAHYYNGGNLSFENTTSFPNQGQVTTYSANNAVTDSAAASTAMATGTKVNNGVISVALPGDGSELETMLELFKKRGKSTGLITTTYPTHATPAGFGAHDPDRNNTTAIGIDLLTQTQPNILFGGGGNGLDPATAASYGYQVATDTPGFAALDPASPRFCALFGTGYMPYEYNYLSGGYPYPHLREMVVKALGALEHNSDGFFLMVEGGLIDIAASVSNLPEVVHETLEFSRAVQAALDWMAGRTDTVVIVTADHETGGLSVTKDNGAGNYPSVSWSTTGHTSANVPVYARGPRTDLISGTIMDNTQFLRLVTLEGTAPAPFLYRVSVQDLTDTTATLVWKSDEACDSRVEIRRLGDSTWTLFADATQTTTHAFPIADLTSGATYEYRVSSANDSGSTTSETYRFATTYVPAAPVTLIASGSAWKYRDDGVDLGTAWREPGYVEVGPWQQGYAELGYGDGGEATTISSSPVRPCYYFRHTFSVANPALYQSLSLEVLRDDGAVVYLNGQEVARYNMPGGTVTYNTWASASGEYTWDPARTIPNLFVAGDNVLAVEVHQSGDTSTDVSFDLELTATPEVTVTLDSPTADATGVTIPATLTATATDPDGLPLTVTFYGRQAPPPVPDFSIIVLPDIQNYTLPTSGGTPAMFLSQIDWIKANRAAWNIAYVTQLGDISNSGDQDTDHSEWMNATNGFYRLETDGIPYGLAVGNHDQYVPAGDSESTTLYNRYFGISHFAGRTYYGGAYGTANNNHYDLFSASGLDFIVIYFDYTTNSGTTQAVLDWADALLKAYPGRRGIAVTHYFLNADARFGVQGQAIYDALKDNPNLFLMLCGHVSGEARRTDVYSGNTVYTLLADYQGYSNGGNGFLRIMTFSPSMNEIRVKTYSPVTGTYETDASSEFTLSYAMTSGPAFQSVQENTGVASGSQTSATWAGLLPGSEYEWYVTASDGNETATSEVRRFATLSTTPPTVSITSPLEGASFSSAPASVPIVAYAEDSDGTVASVEFFAGSTSLGTDLTASYEATATLATGLYTLTAVATDNQGAQTVSLPVHITVGVAPSAPTQLTATAQSRTQIRLVWEDNANNESGYEIRQSSDGVNYGLVQTTGSDTSSATISGLQPSKTYYYIVRAFNALGHADSAPANATTAANNTPAPVDDTYPATEDTPLTVSARGVLGNDTDADGDSLSAILVTGPAHGTLNLSANGSFTYTPQVNFDGADSFAYEATDGFAGALATVTITVSAINDPPVANPDTASTLQGASIFIDVLANDMDIEGQRLSVTAVTQPANGTAVPNGNGTVTYRPAASFTGTDVFAYTVSDGSATAVGTVTVTVTPNILFRDDFETGSFVAGGWTVSSGAAVDNTVAYPQGTHGAQLKRTGSITKTLPAISFETLRLSYWRRLVSSSQTTSGYIEISSDGQNWTPSELITAQSDWEQKALTITKVAGADFHLRFRVDAAKGGDSFLVDDVAITGVPPNGAPVAFGDSYTVAEDATLSVAIPGILSNDTDPEGDPLGALLVTGPSNGALTLNSDGSFTYTPNLNFNGTDVFSYKATDGEKESAAVEVSIAVAPVDDAPLANPDQYSVAQDTPLHVGAPGLLANDTDPESSPLTIVLASGTANGRLYVNADGSFSYIPNLWFNGSDSFSYVVSDGTPNTAWATVTLTVGEQVHVNSILVLSQDASKGLKRGYAEVVVAGADGHPIAGASVTGTFAGSIGETLSAKTDVNGKAVFHTTASVPRYPRLTFTVANVSLKGALYDPAANLESSDRNY